MEGSSGAAPGDSVLVDPVRWLSGPAPPAPDALVPVTDIGPTRAFASVLAERRSDRVFGSLDIGTVGTVLARSGLVRSRWDGADGLVESSRPAPSAGARQPLILVVMANRVSGLPEGVWVLDPDAAALRRVRHGIGTPDHASAAVTSALRITEPPPAVVVTVAQPARTFSRYPTGLPLLWRETGALLATVHLAATDLGLASCIAGTSGVLFTPGSDAGALVDTGAIAIGGSSEDSAHRSGSGV